MKYLFLFLVSFSLFSGMVIQPFSNFKDGGNYSFVVGGVLNRCFYFQKGAGTDWNLIYTKWNDVGGNMCGYPFSVRQNLIYNGAGSLGAGWYTVPLGLNTPLQNNYPKNAAEVSGTGFAKQVKISSNNPTLLLSNETQTVNTFSNAGWFGVFAVADYTNAAYHLQATTPAANGYFARVVDSYKGWAAAATHRNLANTNNTGSLFVYRFDGTNWVFFQSMDNPNPFEFGSFGMAFGNIKVGDSTIIVGAPDTTVATVATAGQVYSYTWNGTNWTTTAIQTISPRAATNQNFGKIIGTDKKNWLAITFRDTRGSAFSGIDMYSRNAGNTAWVYHSTVAINSGTNSNGFTDGDCLAFAGPYLIAGDSMGFSANPSGVVQINKWDGATWAYDSTITNPIAGTGLYFGRYCAIAY